MDGGETMIKNSLISENDNSTVLAEYTGVNRVATSFQSEDAIEKELIDTLIDQGYERLTINSEDELILNLRKQLEKLNNYHFTDGEWDYFFTKVITNKNDYIIEKTRLIQEDYKQELTLDSGEKRNIYLIDKNNIHNNSVQKKQPIKVSDRDTVFTCSITSTAPTNYGCFFIICFFIIRLSPASLSSNLIFIHTNSSQVYTLLSVSK